MGERKQDVLSLINCKNKSYLCPYRCICLPAFPSSSLSSIQTMAKHGLTLFYVKARLSSFVALCKKLQMGRASLLQKTKVKPCFAMI